MDKIDPPTEVNFRSTRLKASSSQIDKQITNLLDHYGIGAVAEAVCICSSFSIRQIMYDLLLKNYSVDDKTRIYYKMQHLLEKKK